MRKYANVQILNVQMRKYENVQIGSYGGAVCILQFCN